MAIQTIGIGAAPDDGTGDKLRDVGAKINANFAELVASVEAKADQTELETLTTDVDANAAQLALLQTVVTSGRVGYALYSALAATTADAGTLGEVPTSDTGTHTDPIVGGTVANSGVFKYVTGTPNGWRWLYSSVDSLAAASAAVASNAATAAGASVDAASSVLAEVTAHQFPGYEADLCGYGWAVVASDLTIVVGASGNGTLRSSQQFAVSLAATTANIGEFRFGALTARVIEGYEADLCGAQFMMIDGALLPIAGGSSAGAPSVSASTYENASNSLGDAAWLTIDVDGNRQVSAFNIATGLTAQLTSQYDNAAIAVTPGKRVIYTSQRPGGAIRYWRDVRGGTEWPFLPTNQIAIFGDSLAATASGIRGPLAAALAARTINFEPIGGQRAAQIVARAGATAQTAVLAGNQVPASGAVAVTGTAILSTALTTDLNIRVRVYGLAGNYVDGVLSRTGSTDAYTFTRDVAGTAINVATPAVVEVISGLGAGYKTMAALLTGSSILIAGRNDVGKSDFSLSAMTALDTSWLENQKTIVKRPLIVGTYSGPADGTVVANYADAKSLNDMRRAKWGDWRQGGFFVDWEAAIVAAGQADTVNLGGVDYFRAKTSFVSDGLHPNDAVGKPILTTALTDAITGKGL